MTWLDKIAKKVDSFAPDPWIVEGRVQSRPTTQLGFFIGVIIGAIIYFTFFQ